ncbi:FAD synthase-like isoform X2 [Corticium candelabrum]|uniref:FAD synthase-like isoform X2 n=1 Tax=Corticium candelabrum TaxID=121492 RepID=UPI002E2F43A0|nr:FAD synthase-like isoform X2 [Corticium candelabrum]
MAQSAVVIIIGDEILKGLTKDKNSVFLCRELRKMGYAVKKISVIQDDVNVIAKEVRQAATSHSLVITTGGLGPTHDDVTIEGIAKAFSEEIVINSDMETILKKHYKTELLVGAQTKMAKLPKSATVKCHKDKTFPMVKVHNVYIYPGVPKFLKEGFLLAQETGFLPRCDHKFYLCEVILSADEIDLAPTLTNLQEQFRVRDLSVGSYPLDDELALHDQVKVTLESMDEMAVQEACRILKDELGDYLVEIASDDDSDASHVATHMPLGHIKSCSGCQAIVDRLYSESEVDSQRGRCIKQAIEVLDSAFAQYEPDQMCLSFNGGKDCTVLLHLYWAALHKRWKFKQAPVLLYIADGEPFSEIEEFISVTVKRYGSHLITKETVSVKSGLVDLLKSHPKIKAIVMGTRRGDPGADTLSHFLMTDCDWPQYMRIFPILEWRYSDIWSLLRHLNIPYCCLYDQGYTSIGSTNNTLPNPALQGDSPGEYLPAYNLMDDSLERAGRVKSNT